MKEVEASMSMSMSGWCPAAGFDGDSFDGDSFERDGCGGSEGGNDKEVGDVNEGDSAVACVA